jgi:hypothetical protein
MMNKSLESCDEYSHRQCITSCHLGQQTRAVMFWKFGFNATTSIEGLLDKENLQLEELLEDADLLQECKSKNTKLVS